MIPDILVIGVLALLLLGGGTILWRRHRQVDLRRRRVAVIDELDEIGVEKVLGSVSGDAPTDLGEALIPRKGRNMARRGTSFFVAPERGKAWNAARGERVLLRFQRRGVRHELRCRVAGRARLTRGARQELGVSSRALYRLVPEGVIVRRERRDMMRFYVGDDARGVPRGFTDARRFVDLRASLRLTDLDVSGGRRLPPRLRLGDVGVAAEAVVPAADVETLDFSGSGLRIEIDLATAASLLPADANPVPEDETWDRLAAWALRVDVRVDFEFPPAVEELEPSLPEPFALLAEVARVYLIEAEEGEDDVDRVRLGLSFLYEALPADETGDSPGWELLGPRGESEGFVAIHSALNQAAARMQSGGR